MTVEKRIHIRDEQARFIDRFAEYGYHNSDEMVEMAIEMLQTELEQRRELERSAELYAEAYAFDEETKEWTEAALQDLN